MNVMNKPISMVYDEFKQQLADLINNSGLPVFLVEPILLNYLSEVKILVKKQYEMDKVQYEEALLALENEEEQD